jgi:hypothetical protein
MHNSPAYETLHSNFGVSALSHFRMGILEGGVIEKTNNLLVRLYVAINRFTLFLQFPREAG